MEEKASVGTIGFIGAGNMADAMIRGIISAGILEPGQIVVVNKSNKERLRRLASQYGVKGVQGIPELLDLSDTVILAVKPADVPDVLDAIRNAREGRTNLCDESAPKLLISVATGIPLAYLETHLGNAFVVVRSMPNIPAQVGEGVMAASLGTRAGKAHKVLADTILGATGKVFWVGEEDLDPVTALSGSGPAYFFRLAQDMAAAGARMGLDAGLSEQLARQTLAGAGQLVAHSSTCLSDLVRQVTSPNGTTAAALSVFEGKRLDLLVEEAMAHARNRSREMAESVSRHVLLRANRVVVKVGSSTVTDPSGGLNIEVLEELVGQIAELMSLGREVILVSSGAVAAGRGKLGSQAPSPLGGDAGIDSDARGTLTDKQVLSAVGQAVLMRTYETLFEKHGLTIAQVLLTKDDFTIPKRSSICRNTLEQLCAERIVPVINENDAVSVDEIRLGDNDTLSARVATLVEAEALFILTDTDGLFSADPRKDPNARLLRIVNRVDDKVAAMAASPAQPASGSAQHAIGENAGKAPATGVGTGGMVTKLWAAEMALSHGIPVVIANGSRPGALLAAASGQDIGTFFAPEATWKSSKAGQTRPGGEFRAEEASPESSNTKHPTHNRGVKTHAEEVALRWRN